METNTTTNTTTPTEAAGSVCISCHREGPTVDGQICRDCANARKYSRDYEAFLRATGEAESDCHRCGHVGLHLGGLCDPCWEIRDRELIGAKTMARPAHTEAATRAKRWAATCADICRVRDLGDFIARFERGWYDKTVFKTLDPWIDHQGRSPLAILISADTGLGKSYLLGELFRRLLEMKRDNAAWITGPAVWEWAKNSTPIGGWAYAPWLIIDDLGQEPATTERERKIMASYLYQIGNARGPRATITSSNLNPVDFESRYGSPVCQRLAPRSLYHTPQRRLFGLKQRSLL